MKKLLSFLLVSLLTILPLTGCKADKAPLYEEELYALDTVISFTLYSDNKEAVSAAKSEIIRLEELLSATNPRSDISRINSAPDTFVNVSDECFELISKAMEVSDCSGGDFDITVYPAVKLWGFTDDKHKVPTDSELLDAKEKIGYNKIEISKDSKSVKVPAGTELDLGGIAKGYIADKAAEVLAQQGVTSALLNFGGNIRLIGTKPQGDNFKIGVKAPFADGYYGVLSLSDATASTAGGYERYFETGGKMYHHILNPQTASPAETDVLSSTVIGQRGEVCDALSTAAFVKGSAEVKVLQDKYPDYSFILLTEDTLYISEEILSRFEFTENYRNLQIKTI